jgi:hypothetical protein
MTRVLWINPLGTDVFDRPIAEELEPVRRPDTEVEVRSLPDGPRHLEYAAYAPPPPAELEEFGLASLSPEGVVARSD